MEKVVLKELKTMSEWLELRHVRVKPEQRKFTKNLIITYLQSRHPAVTPYAVYVKEEIVGYVLLVHAENPAQWIIERLTIDAKHQSKGYGYQVVDQLIDEVHGFANSEMVIVRYAPENEIARHLAKKLKFEEQESLFRKRNVALLEFEFEEIESDEVDDDDETDEVDEDDSEDDDQPDNPINDESSDEVDTNNKDD